MFRTHTDRDTCCTPISTEVYATLNPYALSHHSILSELLHMNSILHLRQKSSGGKEKTCHFLDPQEDVGCFPFSHSQWYAPYLIYLQFTYIWCCTLGCQIPLGTNVILAELLPEGVCTWQWARFHVGWLINTPPKISGRFGGTQQARVGLFALWDYHKQFFF